MTHTLVLVRHAKSDWSGTQPDHERPLGPRGRRQAPESGRWLAAHLPGIGLAVVSPARRARTTWELVSAELPAAPPVRVVEEAYSFGAGPLWGVVRRLPEDVAVVALVGHNPGLEELAEELTGQRVPMPTSALAVIELPGTWADAGAGTAGLRAAGRPPGPSASVGSGAAEDPPGTPGR